MANGTRSVRIQSYTTFEGRERLDRKFHWRDVAGIKTEADLTEAVRALSTEGAYLAYFDEQTGVQFRVTGPGLGAYENAKIFLRGE